MNFDDQFSSYNDSVSKSKPVYSGILGLSKDGQRQVNVVGRGGFVYVRLRDNLSEVIQAYNDKVSPIYDFPVLIQRNGNRWYILGKDTARYDTWSNYAPFLPAHGSQHSFNRDVGTGGDKVDIYPDQFMPLLVYPSGTAGAGMLLVAPYMLQRPTDFIYVGNTGTQNLLVYKPTTNLAILGLVVMNKNTGNPEVLINSGTSIAASITGSAGISPYIPYPQSHQEPLYAFRLVSGTTALTWANLYNARQFVGGSTSTGTSSSGGGISGIVAQDEGVTLGTGTVFNFVGGNVNASISGSVVRVFVTGSSGGSLPTFITGSIPFAQSDGTLTENNPLLYWNNTARNLRIGRNKIPIFDNADSALLSIGANNPHEPIAVAGFTLGTGTLGSPSFTINGYRARGTGTSVLLPVQSGDALQTIIGAGYDGANFQNASRLRFYADGNWVTGTYYPSRIDLEITPSGSSTRRPQLVIRGDSADLATGTYNIAGQPHTHTTSQITDAREILTANRTYYVRADGNDSNTGLVDSSSGAFLTIQKAVNTVYGLDVRTFDTTIQVISGTYTGAVSLNGTLLGSGALTIQGNSASTSQVVISTTSANAISLSGKSSLRLKYVKLQTTTSGNCIVVDGQSSLDCTNVNFGATAGIHYVSQNQSSITVSGNYTISGGGIRHFSTSNGAGITTNGQTITVSGTPAFSSAFAFASFTGGLSGSGITFSGGATGKRYNATLNGVIWTNGGGANYFPGDVAGSTATGGQYS